MDLANKRRPMPLFTEDLFHNYLKFRIPIPNGENHMTTVLERETRTITQTGQGNRQGRCEGCPRCDEPAKAASAKSPIPSTKIDIPSAEFAVIVSCAATTWTTPLTWTTIPA